MRNTILLYILVSLLPLATFANMGSPVIHGTYISEPNVSSNIDILEETIQIKLDDFDKAFFRIIYTVETDRAGRQIPLIFDTGYDSGYRYHSVEKFKVWVDEEEIVLKNIPVRYDNTKLLPWLDSLEVQGTSFSPAISTQNNLHYFEVNLSEGIHTIRVEYIAYASENRSGKVTKYSYSYNLEPARYWRSFGGLTVEIEDTDLNAVFGSNLEPENMTQTMPVKIWNYGELPQNNIEIHYYPEVSSIAKFFISFGEGGLFFLFAVILAAIHIRLMVGYRRKKFQHWFSPVMLTGIFIIPFLCLGFYIVSVYFIDWIIGEHASGRHGYLFLVFLFYPLALFIYGLIAAIVDLFARNHYNKVK